MATPIEDELKMLGRNLVIPPTPTAIGDFYAQHIRFEDVISALPTVFNEVVWDFYPCALTPLAVVGVIIPHSLHDGILFLLAALVS
jgi:hypothetical protein